jgi:serine/threonine protein kinase
VESRANNNVITINPLDLKPGQDLLLGMFTQIKHHDGVKFFVEDKIHTVKIDDGIGNVSTIDIQLEHSLLWTQSNRNPLGYQYHIFDFNEDKRKVIGSGGFSEVVECLAMLVPQFDARLRVQESKYVIKMYKHWIAEDPPKENAKNKYVPLNRIANANESIITREAGLHAKMFTEVKLTNEIAYTFIVMQYVKGPDLFTIINDDCATYNLGTDLILRLIKKLFLAFDEQIASKSIIHRDIKPENIKALVDYVTQRVLNVRFLDFGFSVKENQLDKTACGSPAYVAPEVLEGLGADHLSDVYSLGRVLFNLCRGEDGEEEKEVSDDRNDIIKHALDRAKQHKITNLFQQTDLNERHKDSLTSLIYIMIHPDRNLRFRSNGKLLSISDAVNIIDSVLLERRIAKADESCHGDIVLADVVAIELRKALSAVADTVRKRTKKQHIQLREGVSDINNLLYLALEKIADIPDAVEQFVERLGESVFEGETSKAILGEKINVIIAPLHYGDDLAKAYAELSAYAKQFKKNHWNTLFKQTHACIDLINKVFIQFEPSDPILNRLVSMGQKLEKTNQKVSFFLKHVQSIDEKIQNEIKVKNDRLDALHLEVGAPSKSGLFSRSTLPHTTKTEQNQNPHKARSYTF